jgi:hypothetical protein
VSDLIEGLYPKPKNQNAPDWVIGKLSINLEQLMPFIRQWCKDNPGENWINADMKVGKSGKGYAAVDDWKPNQDAPVAPDAGFNDGDIPF